MRWIVVVSIFVSVFLAGWACLAFLGERPRLPDLSSLEAGDGPSGSLPATRDELAGVERCAECHTDIARQYSRTGHANTFHATRDLPVVRELDGKTFLDPERNVSFHFHFQEPAGLTVDVPAMFPGRPFPLAYALGSNTRAQTFLSLLAFPDRPTMGLEHRVTMYASPEVLDITPGHYLQRSTGDVTVFGVVKEPEALHKCVNCHTTYHEVRGAEIVNVIPHVGCESCHGPGRSHTEAGGAEELRQTIEALHATDADSTATQIERCARCHRRASDFSAEDLRPDNTQLARFQPVGLVQSQCYKASGGRLGCTTCHDPHTQQTQGDRNCLECHGKGASNPVLCPVSPHDGCIRCHLPPVAINAHLKYHDHWIRVRKEPE